MLDELQAHFGRLVQVERAPVAGQRRVEHIPQPMQDHWLPNLGQHSVVHLHVVIRTGCAGGQRAAGHQNDPPAKALDEADLLLVCPDDLVEGYLRTGFQVVGAGAAGDAPERAQPSRICQRTADQIPGCGPVQAHAALGGVHCLGHRKAQVPQVVSVGQRGVPVDRRAHPWSSVGEWIAHDVGRGVRNTSARRRCVAGEAGRRAEGVGLEATTAVRQPHLTRGDHLDTPAGLPISFRLTSRRSAALR